jgi:hypothetical protein
MNAAFDDVIGAADADRRDVFLAAARRLGTAVSYIEKDFWVCWTLDAMFNAAEVRHPRLLFKGGTSLSKSYGLIERFSEDIDITVFRGDLGADASVEALEALSGKQRRARLDAIRDACRTFITGPFLERLARTVAATMTRAHVAESRCRISVDEDDPDHQTLLFWYPVVTADAADGYVRSAVKIEAGAKSALDPHEPTAVAPYVNGDLPNLDLRVQGITTVDPRRTFWDKVVILHGLRAWFQRRGQLRQGGQRVSRHYYDVYRLLQAPLGEEALSNLALAADCARHARMFFGSPDLDLPRAAAGTFALTPTDAMRPVLERDYEAMAGMIMGITPDFSDVVRVIAEFERRVNGRTR